MQENLSAYGEYAKNLAERHNIIEPIAATGLQKENDKIIWARTLTLLSLKNPFKKKITHTSYFEYYKGRLLNKKI